MNDVTFSKVANAEFECPGCSVQIIFDVTRIDFPSLLKWQRFGCFHSPIDNHDTLSVLKHTGQSSFVAWLPHQWLWGQSPFFS
jgi:hypothetical protein